MIPLNRSARVLCTIASYSRRATRLPPTRHPCCAKSPSV